MSRTHSIPIKSRALERAEALLRTTAATWPNYRSKAFDNAAKLHGDYGRDAAPVAQEAPCGGVAK